MTRFILDNTAIFAVITMNLCMLWYWLVAYKYNLHRLATPLGLLIGAIVPTCFIIGVVVLALMSAFPNAVPGFLITTEVNYLPILAASVVLIGFGATAGTALAMLSRAAEEKHKLWYVAGTYQVLMIVHLVTGW